MITNIYADTMRWLTKHTHDVSLYISDGFASGLTKANAIRSSVMSYNKSCSEHNVQVDDTELTILNRNIEKISSLLSQRMSFDTVVTYTVNVPKHIRTFVDDTSNVLIDHFNINHRTVERLLATMSNEITSTLSRKSVLCDRDVDLPEIVRSIVNEHHRLIQCLRLIDFGTLELVRNRVMDEHEYQMEHK